MSFLLFINFKSTITLLVRLVANLFICLGLTLSSDELLNKHYHTKMSILISEISIWFNKSINIKITCHSFFFPLFFYCGDNTLFQVIEWSLCFCFFSQIHLIIYHLIKAEFILKDKYVLLLLFFSNLREKDC